MGYVPRGGENVLSPSLGAKLRSFFLTLSPYGEYALFDWLLVCFSEVVSGVRLATYPPRTSSRLP